MSFEQLDKAIDRQQRRLDNTILEPTVIHCLADIKKVLNEIDPKHSKSAPEIQLATLLNTVEDGKNTTYRVSTTTKSKTKREILIEGLEVIKRQLIAADKIKQESGSIEVNGLLMNPPKFGQSDKGYAWVDPLINHWLGGYRQGVLICWDFDGYQYQYDIFEHKLTRMKNENN